MSKHKNKNLNKICDDNADLKSLLSSMNSDFSELIKNLEKWRGERKISNEKYAQQLAELEQEMSRSKEENTKQLEENEKRNNERTQKLEDLQKESEIKIIMHLEELAKNDPILQDKVEKFKKALGVDSLDDKYRLQ